MAQYCRQIEDISVTSNRLKNDPESIVEDSLNAVVLLNREVALLENHRIVIRRDHAIELADKVKVLAGGCSGHEPAFASYVGSGFLAAAVQGESIVFDEEYFGSPL